MHVSRRWREGLVERKLQEPFDIFLPGDEHALILYLCSDVDETLGKERFVHVVESEYVLLPGGSAGCQCLEVEVGDKSSEIATGIAIPIACENGDLNAVVRCFDSAGKEGDVVDGFDALEKRPRKEWRARNRDGIFDGASAHSRGKKEREFFFAIDAARDELSAAAAHVFFDATVQEERFDDDAVDGSRNVDCVSRTVSPVESCDLSIGHGRDSIERKIGLPSPVFKQIVDGDESFGFSFLDEGLSNL